MCGRFAQYQGIADYLRELAAEQDVISGYDNEPLARYNVAPTAKVALFHQDGETLRADLVHWCWRPHWATDQPARPNGRVEKVAHSPFYRAIWPHRAICPIDGWFEWVDEGGPKKQPYFIRRRDGAPAFCASIGQLPTGDNTPSEHDGFVILTADSSGGMVDIHDRRPVVLAPELAREWLDLATPKERAEQMMIQQGEPSEDFEWFKIDMAVGNVKNHNPELITPIGKIMGGDYKGNP